MSIFRTLRTTRLKPSRIIAVAIDRRAGHRRGGLLLQYNRQFGFDQRECRGIICRLRCSEFR